MVLAKKLADERAVVGQLGRKVVQMVCMAR